jgi:glycosyltransferase involved in cell wall biosynthesis
MMPADRALRVVLVSNYAADEQRSMLRFADMLASELAADGVDVQTWRPAARVGGGTPPTGLNKLLGYIDKYVLYPPRLRHDARASAGTPTVVHICDHSNAMYVRWLRRIPHVVTCHDLIAVRGALGEFPSAPTRWTGRQLQAMVRRGLRQADRIVCDSDATRRDVQRIVGPGEYAVIHPGVSPVFTRVQPDEALKRLETVRPANADPGAWRRTISAPYLLHVGGNQWYKNRAGLIESYAALVNRMPAAPPLVVIGKPLTRDLTAAIDAHAVGGRVFSVPAIDDHALAAAYSRAALLFFPSLVEGFGWPVLEAMACACRVVTSNRLPMPEVGGSVATYVDPADPRDAAAVLESVLREPAAERQRRASDGMARASTFNSRAMARAYLSTYHEAVQRRLRAA